MIEQIINFLNTDIAETGLFTKQYCLAEQVTNSEDKTYPMQYIGKGKFLHVTNISNWLGTSYFRKGGNISYEYDSDSAQYASCTTPLIVTIPLLFIGTVNRSNAKGDNSFTDDRLASVLTKIFYQENPSVKTEINARKLTFQVDEYSTDRKEISEQEFKGIDFTLNYEYSYLSFKLTIKVSINKDCMDNLCAGVLITNEDIEIVTNNELNIEA